MAAPLMSRTEAIYYSILPVLVLSCLALVIGLTYAPCYSSVCVEDYFPYQARGHIGLFYGLLVGVGLALWARNRFQCVHDFFEWHPSALDRLILVTGKRVSMGALLLTIWIAGLSFGSIGYWYPAEHAYWMSRGELAEWTEYIFRVTWTGVIGHWIDIWIGLVVIPVGRNSVLGRVFQLHRSTLLFAHKLLAYALCVGSLIHGLIYYSFLAAWVSNSSNSKIFEQFSPDNPLLTSHQAEARGIYSWFVLPTGALSGIVLIPIIVITSLPVLRRVNYNTFYFIHVIFAALIMVLVCIHASTVFYFLLPGLLLWVGDWAWRVRNAIGTTVSVQVEDASNGWYRVRLPPINGPAVEDEEGGRGIQGSGYPLISYYLNVPKVSRIQAHPFTVAAYVESEPVILFQRGPERKTTKKRDKEWTWKLATLVDSLAVEKLLTLEARIEGPYMEHVPQFYNAHHVLAIAGGTGVTGALSIANFWLANQASDPTKSLCFVWTIKDSATAQLQEIEQLQTAVERVPNAELVVHISSKAGRIDPSALLQDFLSEQKGRRGKAWVYTSGPAGLLTTVEAACTERKRMLQASRSGSTITTLDWHIASFEL